MKTLRKAAFATEPVTRYKQLPLRRKLAFHVDIGPFLRAAHQSVTKHSIGECFAIGPRADTRQRKQASYMPVNREKPDRGRHTWDSAS